jgi:hypothetical protein
MKIKNHEGTSNRRFAGAQRIPQAPILPSFRAFVIGLFFKNRMILGNFSDVNKLSKCDTKKGPLITQITRIFVPKPP